MSLENRWSAADWKNASELWLAVQQYNHRQVIFRKFAGYETRGGPSPDETFRIAKYDDRAEHVWLSQVKVFDTVKGGYFTTGDLDVNSTFRMIGCTPSYFLPNGQKIDEYKGDEIIWNGKVWVVSDQIEPVQFGMMGGVVLWRTVLRRTDRAGAGLGPGAL